MEPTAYAGGEVYREHNRAAASGTRRVELFLFEGWLEGNPLPSDHGAVGGEAMTVEEAEELAERLLAAISTARQDQRPD